MTEIKMDSADARYGERVQHKSQNLKVAFDSPVSIKFCPDLEGLSCSLQAGGARVQHAPSITKARNPATVQ